MAEVKVAETRPRIDEKRAILKALEGNLPMTLNQLYSAVFGTRLGSRDRLEDALKELVDTEQVVSAMGFYALVPETREPEPVKLPDLKAEAGLDVEDEHTRQRRETYASLVRRIQELKRKLQAIKPPDYPPPPEKDVNAQLSYLVITASLTMKAYGSLFEESGGFCTTPRTGALGWRATAVTR
jgi:hypothetical protein